MCLSKKQVATTPRAVAGFAVGEFAALVAAGVMSYDQGLVVVKVPLTCHVACKIDWWLSLLISMKRH